MQLPRRGMAVRPVRAALWLAVCAILILLASATPSHAWQNPPERQYRLDRLLNQLARTTSQHLAYELDRRIWQLWLNAGDTEINSLMREAFSARRAGDFDSAIRLLSTLIERAPDYAEAWNQRATTYYEMGNDAASLADIAETLKREPRHYGAISGRALIAIRAGDAHQAITSIEQASAINPFVSLKRMLPELRKIRDTTTGRPI